MQTRSKQTALFHLLYSTPPALRSRHRTTLLLSLWLQCRQEEKKSLIKFHEAFLSVCNVTLPLGVTVYLSPKVLNVTARHKLFIKLQFSVLVASALHMHPALSYFLKKVIT